jgi:hypothetical protein
MLRADVVQGQQQFDWSQALTVDAHRRSLLEPDHNVLWFVWRCFGGGRQGVHRFFRFVPRVLQDATLVRHMPDVAVTAVDRFERGGDRNVMFGGVVERVLAATDIPLAPGGDHFQVRRECHVGQFEAHLIISFAGAAVREGVGAFLERDFRLATGDQWARYRCAEQIGALVHGARLEQRKRKSRTNSSRRSST